MIYEIKLNGQTLFSTGNTDPQASIINPILKLALNDAGSFTADVPPTHPLYDDVDTMADIDVYCDNQWLWSGRIVEVESDFWKIKSIYCEGALAFLNDSIQPPHRYQFVGGMAYRQYLEAVIAEHNTQVESNRQFQVGIVDMLYTGVDFFRYTNYESTLKEIKDDLIADAGGYIRIRKDDGVFYLDYIANYNTAQRQTISFGENLLDFARNVTAGDIATRVIPLGATLEGQESAEGLEARLTIAAVNDGKVYLEAPAAVERYGKITKVVTFDTINNESLLKSRGQQWLSDSQWESVVFDVSCIDLLSIEQYDYLVTSDDDTLLTSDGDRFAVRDGGYFRVGDSIHVISTPHGLNAHFPLSEMTINIADPSTTVITLGVEAKQMSISGAQSKVSESLNTLKEEKIPTQEILEAAQRNATELINTSTHGFVVLEPNRILIMDASTIEEATNIWQWNSGGLGHSSDGGATYGDAAITMDGSINASFITAGQMSANYIYGGVIRDTTGVNYWNLATGEFHMQSSSARVVRSVLTEYGVSDTATDEPTNWSTGTPDWEQGKFIWARTTTTYSDNTYVQNAVCIQGARGLGTQILGTKQSQQDLPASGNAGDVWLINGDGWTWDASSTPPAWVNVGRIQGPQGATGAQGQRGADGVAGRSGTRILGTKASYEALPATGNGGDCWIVDGDGWTWDEDNEEWVNIGRLRGYDGADGQAGADGQDGADGVSVVAIYPVYALHTSSVIEPADNKFDPAIPEWVEGKHIWTAQRIEFSSGDIVLSEKYCDINLNTVNEKWKEVTENDRELTRKYNEMRHDISFSWLMSSETVQIGGSSVECGRLKTSGGHYIDTTKADAVKIGEDVTQKLSTQIHQTAEQIEQTASETYTKKTETANAITTLSNHYDTVIDQTAEQLRLEAVLEGELDGNTFEKTSAGIVIKPDKVTQLVSNAITQDYSSQEQTAYSLTNILNGFNSSITNIVARNAEDDKLAMRFGLAVSWSTEENPVRLITTDERLVIGFHGDIFNRLKDLNGEIATAIQQLDDRITLVARNESDDIAAIQVYADRINMRAEDAYGNAGEANLKANTLEFYFTHPGNGLLWDAENNKLKLNVAGAGLELDNGALKFKLSDVILNIKNGLNLTFGDIDGIGSSFSWTAENGLQMNLGQSSSLYWDNNGNLKVDVASLHITSRSITHTESQNVAQALASIDSKAVNANDAAVLASIDAGTANENANKGITALLNVANRIFTGLPRTINEYQNVGDWWIDDGVVHLTSSKVCNLFGNEFKLSESGITLDPDHIDLSVFSYTLDGQVRKGFSQLITVDGIQLAWNGISNKIQFTSETWNYLQTQKIPSLQFFDDSNRELNRINQEGVRFFSDSSIDMMRLTRYDLHFYRGEYIQLPHSENVTNPDVIRINPGTSTISFYTGAVQERASGGWGVPKTLQIDGLNAKVTFYAGRYVSDGNGGDVNNEVMSVSSADGLLVNYKNSSSKMAQFTAQGLSLFNKDGDEIAAFKPAGPNNSWLSIPANVVMGNYPTGYAQVTASGELKCMGSAFASQGLLQANPTSAIGQTVDNLDYHIYMADALVQTLYTSNIKPGNAYSTSTIIMAAGDVEFKHDIHVDGYIYGVFNVGNGSDARLKKNISDSTIKALEALTAIDIKSFDWILNDKHATAGIIAQQLQKVAPNLVIDDDDKLYINQTELTYYLVKAIQELADMVSYKPKKKAEWKDPYTLEEKLAYNELHSHT